MKNTITEIKNTPEGINKRLHDTKEQIRNLEDRIVKITQSEQQKEERIPKKNEESLRDLQENRKHTNICIIGVPEWERERDKGTENFEEIMAENFPNLEKEIDIQVYC